MSDFLDSVQLDAANVQAQITEAAAPFTGLRCERCEAQIAGRTDSREQLRALVARAEAVGWQCVAIDGQPLHFCPEHADPDRLRLRRLYK